MKLGSGSVWNESGRIRCVTRLHTPRSSFTNCDTLAIATVWLFEVLRPPKRPASEPRKCMLACCVVLYCGRRGGDCGSERQRTWRLRNHDLNGNSGDFPRLVYRYQYWNHRACCDVLRCRSRNLQAIFRRRCLASLKRKRRLRLAAFFSNIGSPFWF